MPMQNRVFIKAYEAVSAAGYGIDEIFENLLDKRCFLLEDSDFTDGEKALITGRIKEFEKATAFCRAIAPIDTVVFESKNSFEALMTAFEELQSGKYKEVLVFASYKLDGVQIKKLQEERRYSQSVAKPFDFESDGLNAGETIVSVLLSTEKCDTELLGIGGGTSDVESIKGALQNSHTNAADIEYVEAAASGVPSKDRSEAAALAEIFAQGAIISSSKGLTGDAFTASALLSLVMAAKAVDEGIIPASAFLEHSFTNNITLAYANKFKQTKKALVHSNEDEGKYASFVIARA